MTTVALYKALVEAGASDDTAQKAVEDLVPASRAQNLERDTSDLKTSFGDIKLSLNHNDQRFERVETEITAFRSDVSKLKSDVAVVKWATGLSCAIGVAILLRLLFAG